jgi:hypothetical protein
MRGQRYGVVPLSVRDTDLFQAVYVQTFVE